MIRADSTGLGAVEVRPSAAGPAVGAVSACGGGRRARREELKKRDPGGDITL
jgi:hypothetical protein